MLKFDSIVLFVKDIEISRKFYANTFESEGQVLSPTFVSFPLRAGVTIELKQLAQVSSVADTTGGGTELSLMVEDRSTLIRLHELWKSKGIAFIQQPEEVVFGVTFVAIDPDGHRIRVFTPNK